MKKENIIRLRELAKNNSKQYYIFCDNAHIYFSYLYNLIWDDNNERLIVIKANDEAVTQMTNPIEITVLEYEVIQYFTVLYDHKNIDSIADLGVDATSLEKIKEYASKITNFAPIYNKDVGDRTNPFLIQGEEGK